MEIEELFEAIDSEILTDELKNSLQESFNDAVTEKANAIVEEKLETEKETLEEKYNNELNEYREEMLNRMSEYLELVAEEYIEENRITIEESIKIERLDALLEGFDSMLITGGSNLKNINENTDSVKYSKEIEELQEKVNELVESNLEYKAKNEKLIRMGVVSEISEGMTVVEKEKFNELAEMVEFNSDNLTGYLEKLDALRETVTGASYFNKDEEVNEKLNESDEKNISNKSWKRFV